LATPTITVYLSRQSSKYVRLSAFRDAITNLSGLLDSLQRSKGFPPVEWVIVDLQLGSNVATVAPEDEKDYEIGDAVINLALDGIHQMSISGELPPSFDEPTLGYLNRLARVVASEPRDYQLTLRNGKRGVSIVPDIHYLSERWLKGSLPHEDYGSVEGVLKMVTLAGGSYFNVYEQLPDGSERPIECRFNRERLNEVREAVGERVAVFGHLTYDRWERVRRVRVEDLLVFPKGNQLTSLEDIARDPIDLTGGRPSEEYVRSLRDEW